MGTLYITDWRQHVKLCSRHVEVRELCEDRKQERLTCRIPLFKVDRVVLSGRPRISMRIVAAMVEAGTPVTIVPRNGTRCGQFTPARDGDAMLRMRQYRERDSGWALDAAREIVRAKLLNARAIVRRLSIGREKRTACRAALLALAGRASKAASRAKLRGLEGIGARRYFGVLRESLNGQYPAFTGRNRRPPRDPVNALLSWMYAIVGSELRTAVLGQGLDPCIGVFHEIRYNRPALVLDLLECLRPVLCDRLVLRLLNLKVLDSEAFDTGEEGGVLLSTAGKRAFFKQYEQCMTRSFSNPADGKQTTGRGLLHSVAEGYAAALKTSGGLQLPLFR